MAKKLGKRSVWIVRKPKVDRLSDEATTTAPDREVQGCIVTPRASNEEGRGWVIVAGRMVAMPYGTDILATDQVRLELGGPLWDIDGEPGEYENKQAVGKATLVYLKKVGS